MTKNILILVGVFAILSSLPKAENAAIGVAANENSAADDLLGADDAGLDATAPPEVAPEVAPPVANKALEHLDTIKIGRPEITAFMKAGGLKSRLLK